MDQIASSRGLPGSMRGRLLLLVLMVLVPLLVVQAGIYAVWYYTHRADEEQSTLREAVAVATALDAFLRDVHHQELAIGMGLADLHPYVAEQANAFLSTATRGYPSIRSWNWISPEGKILLSNQAKAIGLNVVDRTYFQQLRDGLPWAVSDILTDRISGARTFVIASRIEDESHKLRGVVCAVVDVAKLGEYLLLLHRNEGGTITLFDRKGMLVYNSESTGDIGQNWNDRDPLLTAALQGTKATSGIITLPDRQQPQITARVPVGSIGWMAGASQPLTTAMQHIIVGLWVAGGLNLLVALASGLWAWITSSNMVGQLSLLQTHARAIGRGDFAHVSESTGIRELIDLAVAFNRMGAEVHSAQEALEASNALLEQRVRERTAELIQSTESLAKEQRRFHEVLDMLPAYVVLLTPDYRVPFANRFFEERFGKSDGRRCYEYLFGRTEPCENCQTYEVMKTHAPQRWEWPGPDGRVYDISDFPFTDADGSPLILEMGIDITERRQAEAAVRAVGAYNRRLIEASLDPLVTIGPDGKITDVNVATEQVTGASRAQLIGADFADYFTEPEKAKAGYQKVLAEGQVCDYALTICHVSGRTTDVLYNASVYRNEAGEVQGVFAAARDITERKRTEAELEKYRHHLEELVQQRTAQLEAAKAQLQTVFDVVNVGMLLVDEHGDVQRINDTVSRWVGKNISISGHNQPGDMIGCLHALSDPAGCGLTPHCNSCALRGTLMSVLSTGQPIHDVEMEVTLAGGGKETCLWMEVSADPVELDGKRHVILAMNNATARKKAEAAVERLATFPTLDPNPIVELDLDGKVHYVNPTAEDRFPDLQQEGSSHPWLVDWKSAALDLQKDQKPWSVREIQVGRRWYQQTIHYVEALERVRLYGADITDRKLAEESLKRTSEKLARSNEELEQFAYIASHDLQEPLRVIIGYVQLLERKYKDHLDEDADQFIHYIIDGSSRMQQLINDLLNYSRVGTRGAGLCPTNLQTVLDRVLANLNTVIKETGTTVTHDAMPTIQGDETQLVQLFQNLIGNGIKFHGEQPPCIHISAHQNSNHWELAIRDNGIGIEPQYWDQIFVIFQRLHTRKKYPGTGIGLAICKRIVERHGGRIWLDSQPGQGTTFFFTL